MLMPYFYGFLVFLQVFYLLRNGILPFLSGEHGKKMIKIGVPCKKMLNFGAD